MAEGEPDISLSSGLLQFKHKSEGVLMAEEVRIWQVDKADALTEIKRLRLDLEERIEKWIINRRLALIPGFAHHWTAG